MTITFVSTGRRHDEVMAVFSLLEDKKYASYNSHYFSHTPCIV